MDMEGLLKQYLLSHRQLPLPGIGSLQVSEHSARLLHGEHMISPPAQIIELSAESLQLQDCVDHISRSEHIGEKAAEAGIKQFAATVQALKKGEEKQWDGVGVFRRNAGGELEFDGENLSRQYFQPVTAIRVIHPNETHTVLVGDTETTNAAMVDYFTVNEPTPKSRWFIAAVCIFLLSLATIILYYANPHPPSGGNATVIQPGVEKPTYKQP